MNLSKFFTGYLCLIFAGVSLVNAQSPHQWKEVNKDGYTYKYVTGDPMNARFYHLKNGLTVILSVNKKEPRIQTLIGVRTGSNNDPHDHTGLAHYLEHLLFKGTNQYGTLNWEKEKPYIEEITALYDTYNHTTDSETRKIIYHEIDSVSGIAAKYAIPNEYIKLMADMGAQGTNAHTSVEETVFEENVPSSSIDKYLAVEAERFRYPVFRLFHTELEAVYEEKNRGLDNDDQKVYQAMLSAIFPTNNYGQQSTIGTIEHLKNPSLIAIRDYYNKWYVPNNMTIVMAGDFDPEYVIKKIDTAFSYMIPKPLYEYNPAPELPIKSPILKEVLGPGAENVNIAFRMPGATDSHSQVLLEVLTDMLSNGKAGLMDLNLNQPQKVLGSGAYYQPFKDYTMLVLTGKAKEGQQLGQVKDLMLAQVERIKNGNFNAALLKAVVSNARLANMQGMDDNSNRATTLMNAFIKNKGDNWLDDVNFEDDMAQISKTELIAFAKRYLGNNYAVVYKRTGVDNSIVKAEKPVITPITINRDVKSDFFQKVAVMPSITVSPQWLDFKKDMKTGKIGPADYYYVQNKDNTLFNLYYRFDMGSSNNKYLDYASQYLQFLGTDKRSSEAINKAFYNIACNYSINVTKDVTTVSITGLQENFSRAVSLFDELIRKCKPDKAALLNLKADIQKSREDNTVNKSAIMEGMMSYAMYGKHNPFNYQLSKAGLNSLTPIPLITILHKLLDQKHAVIYYGPLSFTDARLIIPKLHNLPVKFNKVETPVIFEKITQNKNQVLFSNYNMVQSEVYWIRNTGTYDSNNKPTIDVFNSYFGEGLGSVVFQMLRESKALAYSTFAKYLTPDKKDERYSMTAYIGSQADKMTEAINGMNDLLKTMPETNQMFETAKQGIKQDIATQRITKDAIIFNYLAAKRLGLDHDIRKQEYETVDKVTLEDINKFHDLNFKGVPYTYCILISENKITPKELAKFGEVQPLTSEEIFGY